MSQDKRFLLKYNGLLLVSCLLMLVWTKCIGIQNKTLWLAGVLVILVAFMILGALTLVAYVKSKKEQKDD